MVQAPRLHSPGGTRTFPAEICWDDEQPLCPGDHAEVAITVTDDEAPDFLDGGQRFVLWAGEDVGHGTIIRRVFTEYGPC
jgi:GTPase